MLFVERRIHEREPHIDAGADARQKEEKIFSYIKGDSASNRFYYASRDQIMASGVPYDVIRGSKQFSLKLSGNNHRIKTLGHDPLLGYIFGTSNILTSTLTDTSFQSFHVKNGMTAHIKFRGI